MLIFGYFKFYWFICVFIVPGFGETLQVFIRLILIADKKTMRNNNFALFSFHIFVYCLKTERNDTYLDGYFS